MVEFPFTAVIGQQPLKTALLLNAIYPRIGGVLISGPRGSAKSTLARALAAILPGDASGQPPFVTLPLGATEDRLVGSLDLQTAMADGQTRFHEGLLARAHGGVLYVDEVNLLPDALVDLLLDVAASGTNIVERDGISHHHPARFSLVGTMNPEEGELRPQLLDRFGLCLEQPATTTVEERIAIVRQREAFDRDPAGLVERFADEQRALGERIAKTRQRLANITTDDWVYQHIASQCAAAGVEGLRGDVTWHRAALAHAAWRGAGEVTQTDLDSVEPWVLAHRRTAAAAPPEPPSSSGPPSRQPPSGGDGTASGADNGASSGADSSTASGPDHGATGSTGQAGASHGSSDQDQHDQHDQQGQWGAMPPQAQSSVAGQAPALLPDVGSPTGGDGRAATGGTAAGNQPGQGRKKGLTDTTRPDWFATLVANRGTRPWRHLRYRRVSSSQPMLHLVMLDTSGSTLGQRLLGRAKGWVESLSQHAYSAREQLAVFGFGNDTITPLLPRQRAPQSLLARLNAAGGGGGTPLRRAVNEAARLVRQWQRREPGLKIRTYLITDGRTRESLAGLPSLGECLLLDTEQSRVKRGQGPRLARQLGADYWPLTAAFASRPAQTGPFTTRSPQ